MIALNPVDTLAGLIDEEPVLLVELLENPPAHFVQYHREIKGKSRLIGEPNDGLKRVQREILRQVLHRMPGHVSVYCRTGRSIVENAKLHLGNVFVSTFDIADAFPSVTYARVEKALRKSLAANGLPPTISRPITRLCTLNGSLPQGAPTSSALLDIVLTPTDEAMLDLANRRGARYSRYADDITFSSNRQLTWARRGLISSLVDVDLQLNHSKTRHWQPPRRPTITGIVLRDRAEFPQEYVRRIKALVTELVHRRLVPSKSDLASIVGSIGHLSQLHPRLAKRLRSELGSTATPLS